MENLSNQELGKRSPDAHEAGTKFATKYANHTALSELIDACEDNKNLLEAKTSAINGLIGSEYQGVFGYLDSREKMSEDMEYLTAEAFMDGEYVAAKKIFAGL